MFPPSRVRGSPLDLTDRWAKIVSEPRKHVSTFGRDIQICRSFSAIPRRLASIRWSRRFDFVVGPRRITASGVVLDNIVVGFVSAWDALGHVFGAPLQAVLESAQIALNSTRSGGGGATPVGAVSTRSG